MNELSRVLAALFPPDAPVLGKEKTDVSVVQEALAGVAKRNGYIFAVLIAMIGILFVVDVSAVIWWSSQPSRAAAMIASSGITLPFLLYFLRDSWRTKVQADTLLVLVATLEPRVVRSVVKAFLDGLKTPDSKSRSRPVVKPA